MEYIPELLRGKVMAHLDTTDIFQAREVLGGRTCTRCNVPSSILQAGTPQEVKDYCKKLIEVVGKDDGFVLSPRSPTDEAKPANLKALIDLTKEYGVYR